MHPSVAIIGAGPAGLIAAERLTELGVVPTVYEAMPSVGRKFLMAGKSGLNITHGEPLPEFLGRYADADPRLLAAVTSFGPAALRDWMAGLGIESFEGPSGRVFPCVMKASPLLRAWLARLSAQGVAISTRHRFIGWSADGGLMLETPAGGQTLRPAATLFACGGASWRRLGADGAWAPAFAGAGCEVSPFLPSNGGFIVPWSAYIVDKFAGAPVKAVRSTVTNGPLPGVTSRGEFVLTRRGIESGAVYTLSRAILAALDAEGFAELSFDLAPDLSTEHLLGAWLRSPTKQSLATRLRKVAHLSPVKAALWREGEPTPAAMPAEEAVARIKSCSVRITAPVPIDEAISTRGGVAWSALDDRWMVRALPGVFCAGEMVAWDAPTGGYLLTACLATGRAAAEGVAGFVK